MIQSTAKATCAFNAAECAFRFLGMVDFPTNCGHPVKSV
jgi:hypothetical protein